MTAELRKTGIGIVGDIPWGTHFCNFYETKKDLLDILVPYFRTGLENNEFCMWVIFPPHGLEETREALRRVVPNVDQHMAAGDIEILPHTQSYLKGGSFDLHRVIDGLQEKLEQALSKGYEGMRVNGNEAWLTKEDWRDFSAYEEKLNSLIANQPVIVLCTYPLDMIRAAELFDVVRTHKFAIAMRHGELEVLESSNLKRAWDEMRRLNEELERRVIDRTNELTTSNQALIREVSERRRAEKELRVSEAKFRALSENAPAAILIYQGDKFRYANPTLEVITGYSRQELLEMNFWDTVHPDFRDAVREQGLARLRGEPVPMGYEFKIVTKGGEERWIDFTDGKFELEGKPAVIGMALDITERKRAEEALKTTNEQLRALTAKLKSVREEEDRRIGRELHDEIGSAMTSLKWDLEGLEKLCSEESGRIDCSALRERIKSMVELVGTTSSTVQKISSELRPLILDDLGLIAAIEWQAQQFAVRTGIACQFDSSLESIDLDREKAMALFRIIQEALTNILRHSQATRVNIIIEKEDDELTVEVKDNGRGITESEKAGPSSLGLIGMQERAHLINGRIEITGFPGKGTVVTVRVPISNQGSG